MESITRIQAIKLFEEGRTIHVRPLRVTEEDVYLTLHVTKSEHSLRFPYERIEAYQEKYVEQFGKGLCFEVEPLPVKVNWTGNGYKVSSPDLSFVCRIDGREGQLVKFANSRLLQITNSGSIAPQFRKKLKIALK